MKKQGLSSHTGPLLGIKFLNVALTSVAQLVGCWPSRRKVASSIPGQGHMPGLLVPSLALGHIWKATNQCFSLISMFLSLFLPPLPSLLKYILKNLKKNLNIDKQHEPLCCSFVSYKTQNSHKLPKWVFSFILFQNINRSSYFNHLLHISGSQQGTWTP